MLFKSFTGLSVKQFDDVFKVMESKYSSHEIRRLSYKRNRERSIGAGRRFKLVMKDRFIMVLVYYRLYITYTLASFLFGLDQSNVCRDIQKMEWLIRSCLPIPQKLYNATKRLKTREEIGQYFPDKKKKHTIKNLYAVNQTGLIIYKSKHKQIGKKHDYKIYKKNHPDIPKDVINIFDLGFLGVEKDYPKQRSSLPIKKEKDCELSTDKKDYNKNHSGKRIVIEHAICRLKKYKIMKDVFRNKLRKYDMMSDIVSGLVNYRIMNIH